MSRISQNKLWVLKDISEISRYKEQDLYSNSIKDDLQSVKSFPKKKLI